MSEWTSGVGFCVNDRLRWFKSRCMQLLNVFAENEGKVCSSQQFSSHYTSMKEWSSGIGFGVNHLLHLFKSRCRQLK